MARRTRKTTARRTTRSTRGRSTRSTGRARSAAPRSYRSRSSGRRTGSRSAPQTVRIVLETAGAQPVRAGEAVGIGQKVAPAPRVKPRF